MRICNDPASSPADLARVVTLDPVLTARVLHLVNSAYFGLPNPIASITRAVIMLGANTIKNLVLTTSVMERFQAAQAPEGGICPNDFWSHSLKTALVCKFIAKSAGWAVDQREDLFVSGLLHDIGKLALDQLPGGIYRSVAEMEGAAGEDRCRQEFEAMGIDHCESARILAEEWRLGPFLTSVLAFHHRPAEGPSSLRRAIEWVAAADDFVNSLEDSPAPMGDHPVGIPGEPAKVLAAADIRGHLEIELAKAQAFLHVG
jgi:HD-like signal output (HDOD) protein